MRRCISWFSGISLTGVLLGCVFVTLAASSAAAQGDTFLNSRYERTPFRAMGGVDITLDARNPSVAALNTHGEVTLVNIDVYGTLSEGLGAYSKIRELWEADWNFTLETEEDFRELAGDIEEVANDILGKQLTLVGRILLDVGQTVLSGERHAIQFGLYGRTLAGARFRTPPQVRIEGSGSSTQINFGERTRLAHAGSITDAGIYFAPGGYFSTSEKVHISIGGRVRAFYRYQLPPTEVAVDRIVNGTSDITYPREIKEEHGAGVGLDFYTSFGFGQDTNTGFRLGILVEDLVTWIGSPSLKNEFITPRLGLGTSFTSRNERGIIGLDLERLGTLKPTLQVGGSYQVGPRPLNFTLAIGALFNERDIEGTELDPAITGGFSFHLGIVNLGTVVEYQFGREAFNAGVSFGFGWKGKNKGHDDERHDNELHDDDEIAPASVTTNPTTPSSEAAPTQIHESNPLYRSPETAPAAPTSAPADQ